MMSRLFKKWANKSCLSRCIHMLWACRSNLVDVFCYDFVRSLVI